MSDSTRSDLSPEHFHVHRLGECRFATPLSVARYTEDDDRIAYSQRVSELCAQGNSPETILSFEEAGPRSRIFFDPSTTTCGIVTCGGLCPGLNDVIRAVTLQLHHGYGVPRVLGFRYGYAGLSPRYGHGPVELGPEQVRNIHETGGTILGTSRGEQDVGEMVDTLQRHEVNVLFTIGGDGTQRGAHAIMEECARRNLALAIIGIPKTIDNDISFVQATFGLETAMSIAQQAVQCAHTEAENSRNGVGIVKLMGRESGFIAAFATLANGHVNFCLIPENRLVLEGDQGLLACLHRRLVKRSHAVIVVAEGAGQDLVQATGRDASGNVKQGDIGTYIKDCVSAYLRERHIDGRVIYIDPSYIVRSVPANAHDSVYCVMLAQHAVHAAMAGRTDMLVGFWNGEYTHVPIPLAVAERKKVRLDSDLWQAVLQETGQPMEMQ